ncbi:MAG: redoxin domain-containing protein [Crocinitomicaceae bacterium]|nr:redoxin domain-containing protein [Crocinitomicaceae bacterium]
MLSNSKLNQIARTLFLALALPTLVFAASSFLVKKEKELKIGKKVPAMDIQMNAIDDNSYSLSDFKGENGTMVVFSCNTCPFVVGNDNFDGWEKQYNDLYEKAQEANIGFVLVNSNAAKHEGVDAMDKMKERAEAQEYKMNYLMDVDSKVADAFGAKTTPHLYVLDADGKLVMRGSIDNSWDSDREELETYALDAINFLTNGIKLPNTTPAPRGCSIKRNK